MYIATYKRLELQNNTMNPGERQDDRLQECASDTNEGRRQTCLEMSAGKVAGMETHMPSPSRLHSN
jgi:hypothetical protein